MPRPARRARPARPLLVLALLALAARPVAAADDDALRALPMPGLVRRASTDIAEVERFHHLRARERERLESWADLLPFAAELVALEQGRWRLAEVDAREVAGRLDALADEVETLAERVEPEPEPEQDADDSGEADGDGAATAEHATRDDAALDARVHRRELRRILEAEPPADVKQEARDLQAAWDASAGSPPPGGESD